MVDGFLQKVLNSDYWKSGTYLEILKSIPFNASLSMSVLCAVQWIVTDKGGDGGAV